MFKTLKWLNQRLFLLLVLILSNFVTPLLGLKIVFADSPITQELKILHENIEWTTSSAGVFETFLDDEIELIVERSDKLHTEVDVLFPQGLDYLSDKTLLANQKLLSQQLFEGQELVDVHASVREYLENDGQTKRLRLSFQEHQMQLVLVFKPSLEAEFQLLAYTSTDKEKPLDEAVADDLVQTHPMKILAKPKENDQEVTEVSEKPEEEVSQEQTSEEQINQEQVSEQQNETSSPDTSVDSNQDERADMSQSESGEVPNSQIETKTEPVMEEATVVEDQVVDETKVNSSELDGNKEETSAITSEENIDTKEVSSTESETPEKLETDANAVKNTEKPSSDAPSVPKWTDFFTARSATGQNLEGLSAYFDKATSSILAGETGTYHFYIKSTGALIDKVSNVKVTIKLPENQSYYKVSSDLSRMKIAGITPTLSTDEKFLTWEIPEMVTGQTYQTQIQVNSTNGIIPNLSDMLATAVVLVDGSPVYNSGEIGIKVHSFKPSLSVTKQYLGKTGDSDAVVQSGDEISWKVKASVTITDTGGQYLKPGSTITIIDDNPSHLQMVGDSRVTFTAPSIEDQKSLAESKNGIIWTKELTFKSMAPSTEGEFVNTATANIISINDEEISQKSNQVGGSISKGNNPLAAPKGQWAYSINLGPSDANGNKPAGFSAVSQANPNPTVPNSPNTRLGFTMNYNVTPLISRDFYDSLSTGYTGPIQNNGRTVFNLSVDIGWDQGTHPRRVRQVILKDTNKGTSKTYQFDNNGNSTDGSGLKITYGASQHFGTAQLTVPTNFFNDTGKWNGTRTRHPAFDVNLTNHDGVNFSYAHEGIGPDWNVSWSYNSGYGDYNPIKNDYHFVGLNREVDANLELDELRVSIGSFFAFGRANYQLPGGKIANGTSANYPTITIELNASKGNKSITLNSGDYAVHQSGPFHPNGQNYTIYHPYISLNRDQLGLEAGEHVNSFNVIYGSRDRSEILNAGFTAYVEDYYTINPNLNNTSPVKVMNKNHTFGELALVNLNGTGARVQPFVRRPIGAADDNGLINTKLGPRTAMISAKDTTPAIAKITPEFLQRDGNIISSTESNRLRVTFSNIDASTKNLDGPLMASVLLPKGVTVNQSQPNWSYSQSSGQVVEILDNFNGTDRQLIRYQWEGDGNKQLKPGKYMTFEVDVSLSQEIPSLLTVDAYGSSSTPLQAASGNDLILDADDVNGNQNTSENIVKGSANYHYVSNDLLTLTKSVKGNRDAEYSKMGHADLGGEIRYHIRVENADHTNFTKLAFIDVLPSVGDLTILSNQDRQSRFTPLMTGPITLPVAWDDKVEVYYSESTNPKRDQIYQEAQYPSGVPAPENPAGAEEPNWRTADQVTNWEAIHSFMLKLKDGVSSVSSGQDIYFVMKAPERIDDKNLLNPSQAEEADKAAWNSVAGTVNNLQVVEPERVGVVLYSDVTTTSIRLHKLDANNQKALEGVQFKLADSRENADNNRFIRVKYDASGQVLSVIKPGEADYDQASDYDVTTDSEGYASFSHLEVDADYWIVETKALEGYIKLLEPIAIHTNTKENASQVLEKEVLNHRIPTLPSTGGQGVVLFLVIGGVIMGSALYLAKRKAGQKQS